MTALTTDPTASSSAVWRFMLVPILTALLLCGLAPATLPAAQAGATAPPMTVMRVVAGRVDIAIPGAQKLAVGARLIVERSGVDLAELEVTLVGEHEASCRIVSMSAAIAGGDIVRPVAKRAAPAASAPSAQPAPKAAAIPPASAPPKPQGTGSAPSGSPAASPSQPATAPVEVHYTGTAMTVLRAQLKTVDISILPGIPVAVGDRLAVERGGSVIGEIEVVLMGEHSATCRIDRELRPITEGDLVRPLPALAVAATPTPAAEPEKTGPIRVRQVLAEEVFLDAGRAAGLVAGQRVKIVRAEVEIAELEIAFIANHSASCKILSSTAAIEVGDLVVPGPVPVSAAPTGKAGTSGTGAGTSGAGTKGPGGKPIGWVAAEHTDYSGSVALRYQAFRDGGPSGRDFDQESALVNVYLGHIAGSHYDFRLRGTTSREQIRLASGPSQKRDNDRLYEATLSYEPPGARFSYQVGRLISGPLVGFDYLDGAVGEFHLTRRFNLGAFYGSRSNGDQLTFKSRGRAYGLFAHWLDQAVGSPFYAEYLLEAIGDYIGGLTNREYLSFYGRQGSGSRWSLYERAEFDQNRNWQGSSASKPAQLSNVLFSGSYSFSKAVRLGLSYDQSRQILTLDDRFTPEELFDNSLREGVRLTAYLGSAKTVRANLSVGERWKQGNPDRSKTYNANVYHSNVFHWNLLVGADYSGFTGDTSKGFRAGLRLQKYFSSGHDIELTFGTSATEIAATLEQRKNQWARLSGTFQLGRRLYLLGEYEKATGDDLEGDRLFLQLGYRL